MYKIILWLRHFIFQVCDVCRTKIDRLDNNTYKVVEMACVLHDSRIYIHTPEVIYICNIFSLYMYVILLLFLNIITSENITITYTHIHENVDVFINIFYIITCNLKNIDIFIYIGLCF